MLQATATPFTEQRTFRLHAIVAPFQNFYDTTPCKIFLVLHQFNVAKLVRQAPLHKTGTSIGQASKALSPLDHLFYAEFKKHYRLFK
jgi:hypothetical protein